MTGSGFLLPPFYFSLLFSSNSQLALRFGKKEKPEGEFEKAIDVV